MEPYPERIFSVGEAEGLLEVMREVLGRIRDLAEELGRCADQLQILDVLWGGSVRMQSNPDHAEFGQLSARAAAAREQADALVREEILARGIRFPVGGGEHGLIDFPTTLDGRIVYLCWHVGEPGIGHWHEIDGGFAGRQPLTREIAERMGR